MLGRLIDVVTQGFQASSVPSVVKVTSDYESRILFLEELGRKERKSSKKTLNRERHVLLKSSSTL